MNPYEVLGVDRNADLDAIKRAYRELAKKHHPDAGGDRAKFEEITLAYETLSDSERRAKYDADGVIDGSAAPPDPLRAGAIQIIHAMVNEVLQQIGDGPIYDNIIGKMKEGGRRGIDKIAGDIIAMKAQVKLLRKFAKRFSAKKDNIVAGMIEAKAAGIENNIPRAEQALKLHELAVEILDDHSFEADELPQMLANPGWAQQQHAQANAYYGGIFGGSSNPFGFSP